MCKECGWEEFAAYLDDLLTDSDYSWAEETIEGIMNTITDKGHVTDNQRGAISNIEAAIEIRRK